MTRVLVISLLAGALGAWVAGKNGRNWVLWGLICALFPLSLIVLAILPPRIEPSELRRCPSCGMPNRPGDTTCRNCSQPMPIDMVKCPSCGKYVPDAGKCSECGSRL